MKIDILKPLLLLAFLYLAACASQDQASSTKQGPPNVIFIAVDDLRPELNCYGQSKIHSPNLDQLAQEGFLFERAYCNIPVCGASRASILTGMRPRPDRFLDFSTRADEDAPEALSLPQHFKQNGYHTLSMGKVFHHRNDKPDSWSELPWHPGMDQKTGGSWRNYLLTENIAMDTDDDPIRGPAYEKAAVLDTAYFDGKIATRAMQK
jgi:arylsulfatase A-like enzyme